MFEFRGKTGVKTIYSSLFELIIHVFSFFSDKNNKMHPLIKENWQNLSLFIFEKCNHPFYNIFITFLTYKDIYFLTY